MKALTFKVLHNIIEKFKSHDLMSTTDLLRQNKMWISSLLKCLPFRNSTTLGIEFRNVAFDKFLNVDNDFLKILLLFFFLKF